MGNEGKQFKWVGTRPIRPDGVDKVTGQAKYGADLILPGMLVGRVLRSPHAHARIRSIDTSKAAALPGVKAVVTGADFPDHPSEFIGPERVAVNVAHITRNVMAKEKALYEGHAVAAVAATTTLIAEEALSLIEVDYEVLPHVIDVEDAMKPDAPLLFEDMTTRGVDPAPSAPSNVSKRAEFTLGDVDQGFAAADEVVEMSFTTKPVHQGYIEPHACVARYNDDGQGEVWCSSQGHFQIRALTSKILNIPLSNLRVMPAEIGGGFGGKTVVYLEPVALALSMKCRRPVRAVMTRAEVFQATGPTSGSAMKVKIGATREGKITAAEGIFDFQAGAFPGSPVLNACMCSYAPYEIENVRTIGHDVVSNRPKAAAYRAPGSPISAFAVEQALDVLAKRLGIDPVDFRLMNAAKEGTQAAYGPKFGRIGYIETLEALKEHPAYKIPLGPNQGRGVASGYWFNAGGESSATVQVNEDGTVVVATGSPDIGGSRASMAIMAAETFGIDYANVRAIVADTASVGYTHVTGGSRVTLATGLAVVEACNKIVEQCR
jgi:CO/xanthine dehydrogenase Mo-binding subunit